MNGTCFLKYIFLPELCQDSKLIKIQQRHLYFVTQPFNFPAVISPHVLYMKQKQIQLKYLQIILNDYKSQLAVVIASDESVNLTFLKSLMVFQIDQSDILKMPPAGAQTTASCDYTLILEFKLTITDIFLHIKMIFKRKSNRATINVNKAKDGS